MLEKGSSLEPATVQFELELLRSLAGGQDIISLLFSSRNTALKVSYFNPQKL